ncbi:MAG: FMN-binding protein [Deltaproteobacteria bacterium]|nr:FMN-binding protein [Deltaproteobacteria bacterium]
MRSTRPHATLALLAALLLACPPAGARRFMGLKQAVRSLLPEGAEVFKITRELSEAQRARLKRDCGYELERGPHKIYLGKDARGKTTAYVFIIQADAGDWRHRFAVGVAADGSLRGVRVMELSNEWPEAIRTERFLSQFEGKCHTDALSVYADIDGVTGATVSSELTAVAARQALSLHHLLFGGGGPVEVPEAVRKARLKGQRRIEQADRTGR